MNTNHRRRSKSNI